MVDKFVFILFSAIICFASQGAAKIISPCNVRDTKCIADNLSSNSKCRTNVKGQAPEYYISKFEFKTPYFNSTYTDTDLYVRNQDKCFVSVFFFNTESGRAVMTIECPDLDLESERQYIQHETYKEDAYYSYHIRAVYPLVRITITFKPGQLDLCTASIFADAGPLPILKINPNDKPTANRLTRDLTLLNIYERENFAVRGPGIAYEFVSAALCDYGCPLPP